jgi:hypothetical protein
MARSNDGSSTIIVTFDIGYPLPGIRASRV